MAQQLSAGGTVNAAGIFADISLRDYVRDALVPSGPSFSASLAHVLLTKSPRHAWIAHPRLNPAWQPEATEQTEFGTIAHALLLERDESRVVVVDAADWRTNAAKEQRARARAEGKFPILAEKFATVRAMVTEGLAAIGRSSEMARVFADGEPERTLVW